VEEDWARLTGVAGGIEQSRMEARIATRREMEMDDRFVSMLFFRPLV